MPRNAEQKVKLLILYDILQKNTDDTHALNTDEIIALLEKRGIAVSRIKTSTRHGCKLLFSGLISRRCKGG